MNLTITEYLGSLTKNNPYAIHKELLAKRDAPTPEALTVKCRLGEIPCEFNFSCALKEMKKLKNQTMTLSELKTKYPNINPETCRQLLTQAKAKASTLPQQSEDKTDFQNNLNAFEHYSSGTSSSVYKWMHWEPKDSTEPVPTLTIQLYFILNHILNQSNEEKHDDFSQQETVLISFLKSLKECQSGQDEGIQQYYTLLLQTTESKEAQTTLLEDPSNFLLSALEQESEAIHQNLKKQSLIMLELLPPYPRTRAVNSGFNQLVHQIQYLENLLSEELGFNQTVRFDRYGVVISKELREKSKADLLTVIAKHSSQKLLERLKTHINKTLEGMASDDKTTKDKTIKVYNHITSTLGASIKMDEAFTLDDNYNITGITDKGILKFLEKLGYVTPPSEPTTPQIPTAEDPRPKPLGFITRALNRLRPTE